MPPCRSDLLSSSLTALLFPHQQELVAWMAHHHPSGPPLLLHGRATKHLVDWACNHQRYCSYTHHDLQGRWHLLASDTQPLLGERNLRSLSYNVLPALSVVVQGVEQEINMEGCTLAHHLALRFPNAHRAVWTMEAVCTPLRQVQHIDGQCLRFHVLFQDVSLQTLTGTIKEWKQWLQVHRMPDGQWQGALIHPLVYGMDHLYSDGTFRITQGLLGTALWFRLPTDVA